MIMHGTQRVLPVHGNYEPLEIRRNNARIAGWDLSTLIGESVSFADTYNDLAAVTLTGKSEQTAAVWGTNLVTGGDFPSTTAWTTIVGTCETSALRYLSSPYSLKCTATGSGAYTRQNFTYTTGHKTYIRWSYYVESYTSGSVFAQGGTVADIVASPTVGTWVTRSKVGTQETGGGLLVNVIGALSGTMVGYFDNFISIDLTKEFGAGHEPTAAQMDTMLTAHPNSWFDGKGQLTTDVVTYTANSPSPTYPATISSVEICDLISCGKNLLPLTAANSTISGVTISVSNGIVTANGTATGEINLVLGHMILPATTVFLSGCPAGASSTTFRMQFTDYPVVHGYGYDYGDGVAVVITTAPREFAVRITIRNGITVSNLQFRPQLEIGSSASSFAPYQGTTITTPYALPSVGSVADTWEPYVKIDGVWRSRYTQRIGIKVFDGTENVQDCAAVGTSGYRSYVAIADKRIPSAVAIDLMCTHFKPGLGYTLAVNQIAEAANNNNIWISWPSTIGSTVADFKSWLAARYAAGTPVTVYYQLAEPITYTDDPIDVPTYPDTTIITTDGTVKAMLDVTAKVMD